MFKKIVIGYLIANGLVWAAVGVGEYCKRGIENEYRDPYGTLVDMLDEGMAAQAKFCVDLWNSMKYVFKR